MPNDLIAEMALVEVSRAQREAWIAKDWLAHWYWTLIDAGRPASEALAVVQSIAEPERIAA